MTIKLIIFTTCLLSQITLQDTLSKIKQIFGPFPQGQSLKFVPLAYDSLLPRLTSGGQWLPQYRYLDSVQLYSMAHLSDGLFVTGFMVTPRQPGKYPCIVFNRGGNRDYGRLSVEKVIELLAPVAARGYVVVASNYRGNSTSEGRDEFGGKDVNDVLNLINSLHEIPQADTSRIGMWGISRGGAMTYRSLCHTQRIKAAVVIGGMANAFVNISNPDYPMEQVYRELLPNYEQERNYQLSLRSAVYQVELFSRHTPLLILHGSEDFRVRLQEAQQLAANLRACGLPYYFVTFRNEDHVMSHHRQQVREMMIQWFHALLRDGLIWRQQREDEF